jgi:hypothetical protein
MVGQHHAARADAYRFGPTGHMADHYRRRGAGDAGHIVMLGKPEAPVSPLFRVLGEIERVGEGLRRARAGVDRREVEDRERDHGKFVRSRASRGSRGAMCSHACKSVDSKGKDRLCQSASIPADAVNKSTPPTG